MSGIDVGRRVTPDGFADWGYAYIMEETRRLEQTSAKDVPERFLCATRDLRAEDVLQALADVHPGLLIETAFAASRFARNFAHRYCPIEVCNTARDAHQAAELLLLGATTASGDPPPIYHQHDSRYIFSEGWLTADRIRACEGYYR